VAAKGSVTADLVVEAEKLLETLTGDQINHGNLYVKAMKKINVVR
jgi:hypothetical protein